MRRFRGKGATPELLVRKYLSAKGFRYSLHDKDLPGTPDIILEKYMTLIFIHNCFLHGHKDCEYSRIPDTKTEWWKKKIGKTKEIDKENKFILEQIGWKVITIWECQLMPEKKDKTLYDLIVEIKKNTA